MFLNQLLLASVIAAAAQAASVSATSTLAISTITSASISVPTGSYQSYSSQILLTSSTASNSTITANNGTLLTNSTTSSINSKTSLVLVGSSRSTTIVSGNSSSTSTSSAATPTNTQPCNNYPEFCNRKYSNITEVCAHNSAFVKANSAFSNQQIAILGQLNDGIRMIQGEVHYVNDTLYSCHSNCTFLNAGTYEAELTTVREWVEANPYNVVTVLIVNSDYVRVQNFTAPIVNSGLIDYVYYPPKVPMELDDWPTLGEMILTGKRVVVFMDYMANETEVPYILDEFSQMWETPFSPTDPSFPCTVQRPPGITSEQARNRLYLANHNLNVEITISGDSLLIPNFADLAEVNADSGNVSLGLMSNSCRTDWDRAPNFLLVDFYNLGNFNGSVFEVAAEMNSVSYDRKCCGTDTSLSGGELMARTPALLVVMAISAAVGLLMLT